MRVECLILLACVSLASSWTSPAQLTTDPHNDIAADVVQDASGRIWVVWTSDRSGPKRLYYKIWNGNSWSNDEMIPSSLESDEWCPSMAATENETYLLFHSDWTGSGDSYYSDIFMRSYSEGWGEEINITAAPSDDITPSMACSSSCWVFWATNRYGSMDIVGKNLDSGILINVTTNKDDDFAPDATFDSNGNLWVVWESERDGNREIYYRIFNGTWGPETRLTYHPAWDKLPSIADVSGSIWIVWTSNRSGNQEIWKVEYNGTWSDPEALTNDPSRDYNPSLMVDRKGDVWLVWESDRSGNWDIWYMIYDRSPPRIISTSPHGTLSTRDVILSVSTDEGAYCRFSSINQSYDEMPESNEFEGGGGVKLSRSYRASDGMNTVYVSCIDLHGNSMSSGVKISFEVAIPSGGGGGGAAFVHTTPTPTPSATATPTPTPTPTRTQAQIPTETPSATPTPTAMPSPTPTKAGSNVFGILIAAVAAAALVRRLNS